MIKTVNHNNFETKCRSNYNMAKKINSPEHNAKIYGVNKSFIDQWSLSRYGESQVVLPAAENKKIAIFLGVIPKKLKEVPAKSLKKSSKVMPSCDKNFLANPLKC